MGTVQHFVLFEHITGFGLFRVKEFDEITRNFKAHANAFIKPVAFVHFKSVQEAVENVQSVVDGSLSDLLKQFLRRNVPPADCVLGVSDEIMGKSILACDFGFECIWLGSVREVLRVIRENFARLTRSLITQPGAALSLSATVGKARPSTSADEITPGKVAESRARVVVSLARARLQLGIGQHLADTGVVKVLKLIDELDTHLTQSTSRLRACYSVHFPEVCRPHFGKNLCLDDMKLLQLIASFPLRSSIISNYAAGSFTCMDDDKLTTLIATAAEDSIGADLGEEDCENLKKYAQRLIQMNQVKKRHIDSLLRRITNLCPNLHSLLTRTLHPFDETERMNDLKADEGLSACLIAARLIANAGSFNRLASMPSTRILSLGASKALFRKSGAVVATSTGLLSNVSKSLADPNISAIHDSQPTVTNMSAAQLKILSANRVQRDTVRRRAARLLAAKSTLACRADCFRQHNPIFKQPDSTSEDSDVSVIEDERLRVGVYGDYLGKTVQDQLRIWAETNGIHKDRTEEQNKAQRERRKKYRKSKRKAWLARKLSKCTTEPRFCGVPSVIEPMDVDVDDHVKCNSPTSRNAICDNGELNSKETTGAQRDVTLDNDWQLEDESFESSGKKPFAGRKQMGGTMQQIVSTQC
ncbi:unnamed protein product [Heterobilharzia americana]|nr:unnamed protein product [Heterobilharzia americana]